jgi:ParB family chromosome partitioning protein
MGNAMSTATAKATTELTNGALGAATTMNVPAASLVFAKNIRHQADASAKEEMKASILANGLLQNLIAAPRSSDGTLAVFAGCTRLVAVQELIAEGLVLADFRVPVLVYGQIDPESPEAISIAMSENMIRSQMDYVDECAAMLSLASAGRSDVQIAAIFGYRARTVRERLLIGRLISEAHGLVRDKVRSLEWARALTLADKAMQKKICEDIAANPASWKDGEDIRRFLTKSTVPAEHALFDIADYTGAVVSDFFEGDKLADIDAFWQLQNEAIEDRRLSLEAEGWSSVTVLHEPLEDWNYEATTDKSVGVAVVEVSPNGKVVIHRGLAPLASAADVTEGLQSAGDTTHVVESTDEIAAHEVRPTATMCQYAHGHRTAMVQVKLSTDFRASIEYTVLAMLGHRGASFGVQPVSINIPEEARSGKAFKTQAGIRLAIDETFEDVFIQDDAKARDLGLTAMVKSMDDEALQSLFSMLVSQRAGQRGSRGIDDSETSLMNHFGGDIDIRSLWEPDEIFFGFMTTEDLRRLSMTLVPGMKSVVAASMKKKDLCASLAGAFTNARDGVGGSPEAVAALNAWVPGVMTFPAKIAKSGDVVDSAIFAEAVDLDAMVFGPAD